MRPEIFRYIVVFAACLLWGCSETSHPPPAKSDPKFPTPSDVLIKAVELSPLDDHAISEANFASLQGARNEWIELAVRISGHANELSLTLDTPVNGNSSAQIAANNFSCYQIVPLAGKPSALVPLNWQPGTQNWIDLRPSREPTILCLELHVPANSPAGKYTARCRLADTDDHALATLPLELTVYDFTLPIERHLQMAGFINFDAIASLDPSISTGPSPRLLSRLDPASTSTIALLDWMVGQAQAHRVMLEFPQLQPDVNLAAGQTPEIDWTDFDSVVGPWLTGRAFADQFPLGWWPIPRPELLNSFDSTRQQQYWKAAAAHFIQQDWLTPATVFLDDPAEMPRISQDIATILSAHPLLNVTVPLRLSEPIDRVRTLAEGLVSQTAPIGTTAAKQWLRPDPNSSANESDLRLWAWLAFLRHADVIVWPDTSNWFYAGAPFEQSHPVASSQLLWLRRAEQDYEYLWLAQQRGQVALATQIAGLLTRFVQVPSTLEPKPSYALLCGTADPQAWSDALALTARLIHPMDEADRYALNVDLAEWQTPKARPLTLPAAINWRVSSSSPDLLSASIGIDIYNGTGRNLGGDDDHQSTLVASSSSSAWRFNPAAPPLPRIEPCGIARLDLPVIYDLSKLPFSGIDDLPIQFTFLDGFTRRQWSSEILAPIAASDRRSPEILDGSLKHWSAADLIHDGPLVSFLDRNGVARQRIVPAPTASELFTGWSNDDFYVAFLVRGAKPPPAATFRNFVDAATTDHQDLCELLIAAIYPDNTTSPPLHVICQTNALGTERKLADHWQPANGSAIRYAGSIDGSGIWRGELAIPWTALLDPGKARPRILRFNFTQRRGDGSAASWAGPVDSGRDELLTGLLYLRDTPP
jgi:hypothetical protein